MSKMKAWFKKRPTLVKYLKNIAITLAVILFTIPLQFGLDKLDVRDENLFLIYVVAILIILIETKNLIFGIVSSFLFVLSFNFFQTDPIYSLDVADPNYYVSFLIFLVVSLIVGTLVIKLQTQNKIAIENERKVRAMYDLSSQLLDNHDKAFVFNFVINFFSQYLNKKFTIVDVEGNLYGEELNIENKNEMIKYCLEKNIVIGKGTFMFKDSNYMVFPVKSKTNNFGALFINLENDNILEGEIEFVKKNILHLVVVLDREYAVKAQENTKLTVEKEKFKTALLRSLSHDIKTPLTSIQSGSDLILSSYDKLDDDTKKSIIKDIYAEACDLNVFIVNLLNMSKLDEMKKIVNLKKETVDDILSEVSTKASRILNGKKLEIKQSEKLTFVYTDATLLEQVLVNLVDNAVKHTKPDTEIKISYESDENGVTFHVIDNGGGIKQANIDKIFEDFYSLTSKQDHSRSNGLGLSICRAIVEAHGGKISAKNNEIGGATFTFNIPNSEEC